jgi:histidyl-tRNA synthetase
VQYLQQHHDDLDEDSKRRLQSNPLRILDSKNPDMQTVIQSAPRMSEYLDQASNAHFSELRDRLEAAGIEYVLDETLVRGLDYYSDTVFEWVTDMLGAQGTICAGGRYDGLVSQLGGKDCPAVGFAMGLERLVEMLAATREVVQNPNAYFVGVGDKVQIPMQTFAEELRNALPGLRLVVNGGGGSFKSQFKKADRSGAAVALILGEDEYEQGVVGIKYLRDSAGQQQTLKRDELAAWLKENLQI